MRRKIEEQRSGTTGRADRKNYSSDSGDNRQPTGTIGTVPRVDCTLAVQLYQRGVSANMLESSFVLAAGRLRRPADYTLEHDSIPGLFLPVIEEVLGRPLARSSRYLPSHS